MDVHLSAAPSLNCEDHTALYSYLRDVSVDSIFATSVLQVLVEEHRTAHCTQWNEQRTAKSFKIGDVVKARVQVYSQASKGEVHKLSYQARGPFQITKVLDANAYIVQHYNEPDLVIRKYKGSELYLLPPSIFPHGHMETMVQYYLDFSHAPIVSSLTQALKIELYNNTFLPSNSKHIIIPSLNQPSCALDIPMFTEHTLSPIILSAASLFKYSNAHIPAVECVNMAVDDPNLRTNDDLYDALFFIQYTPEGTIRCRWYLIQVDMESTLRVNKDYATNRKYWCIFLAWHPDDTKKVMRYADSGLTGTYIVPILCQAVSYMRTVSLSDHLQLQITKQLCNGLLYCCCIAKIRYHSLVHFHLHQLMNSTGCANAFTEIVGTY